LYVVSRRRVDAGLAEYGLFALDVRDGKVLRHKIIQGETLDGRQVPFVPAHQGQRSALLLSGGSLYVAFGVWGDEGKWEYHGLVLRYDAQTFALTGAFNA